MKTILFSILITLVTIGTSSAQQISLNSLYNVNKYHINSAYAGFNETFEAYLNHRAQWVGIQSAPSTSFLSVQSKIAKNMGLGGVVMYDQTDLSNTFTGVVSYAYRIKLGEAHNLRLGVSAGIYQSSITPRNGIVDDPLDEVVLNGNHSQIAFKNDVSLYYNFKGLEFGFSVPQIFETAKTSSLTTTRANIELKRHMVAYLGYDIALGNKWNLQPSVLYRGLDAKNNQLDLNAQVTYNKLITLGGGYRTNSGVLARFGLQIKDMLQVAYAYEFAGNQLRSFTSGTHEIMIGIKLRKKTAPIQQEQVTVEPEPVVEEEIIEEEPIAETPVEVPEPEEVDETVFDFDIRFPLNDTDIDYSFTSELDKIVDAMKKHPEIKLEVVGHSCDLGAEITKRNIAQQRANIVKTYLIDKGIDASRVSSSGKSDDQPLVPNNSEQNRKKNRRVEFKVIK